MVICIVFRFSLQHKRYEYTGTTTKIKCGVKQRKDNWQRVLPVLVDSRLAVTYGIAMNVSNHTGMQVKQVLLQPMLFSGVTSHINFL